MVPINPTVSVVGIIKAIFRRNESLLAREVAVRHPRRGIGDDDPF